MSDDLETCPVCQTKQPDMRHVMVECFYQVSSSAPQFTPLYDVWSEVPKDGTYLGVLRDYSEGAIGALQTVPSDKDGVDAKIERTWDEKAPSVRLQQLPAYNLRCCKACRADFLGALRNWASGGMVDRSQFCRD